jgi:hypothetical protein
MVGPLAALFVRAEVENRIASMLCRLDAHDEALVKSGHTPRSCSGSP